MLKDYILPSTRLLRFRIVCTTTNITGSIKNNRKPNICMGVNLLDDCLPGIDLLIKNYGLKTKFLNETGNLCLC